VPPFVRSRAYYIRGHDVDDVLCEDRLVVNYELCLMRIVNTDGRLFVKGIG